MNCQQVIKTIYTVNKLSIKHIIFIAGGAVRCRPICLLFRNISQKVPLPPSSSQRYDDDDEVNNTGNDG